MKRSKPKQRRCKGTSKQRKREAASAYGLPPTATIEEIHAARREQGSHETFDETRELLRCKRRPSENGTCSMHGGLSPSGAAHYKTTDGLRSRATRRKITSAFYAAAETDQELFDLRRPLRLLDMAVAEAARTIEEGGSPQSWLDAQATFKAMQAAQRSGDLELMARKLDELGPILRGGADLARSWSETIHRTSVFAQRVEAQWGLRMKAAVVVNANDVVAFMMGVLSIVNEETDASTSKRIESRVDAEVLGGSLETKAIAGPVESSGEDLVA